MHGVYMNRLVTKTSGFSPGRKIFINSEGSYLLSEANSLPEGYVVGAEVPSDFIHALRQEDWIEKIEGNESNRFRPARKMWF
jgi:hypothetical protein